MKKVLFDLLSAQPVGNTKFHGGGEYIKTIFQYLIENYSNEVEISVFFNKNAFMDDYILKIIEYNSIEIINITSINELNKQVDLKKYNIFYSGIPYAYGSIIFPDSLVRIGTFHGLRVLEKYTDEIEKYYYDGIKVIKPILKKILYPSRIKKIYKYYYSGICNFNKIICSSNHTKYAIKNFFPTFYQNIEMFYVPTKYIELDNNFDDEELKKIGKYILLIGLNRWEKNGYRAIKAIENLFKKNLLNGYKVVTVGKIPRKIKKIIKNKENYIFYGYVETEKLESLYKNCEIFLYPSLNEGFGMPPLEAMKYGKTCIVSAVCSLPEICGNAVMYVNPYDIAEIQNRIINAITNKIDIEKVKLHQKVIAEKQKKDLKKICEYIIN